MVSGADTGVRLVENEHSEGLDLALHRFAAEIGQSRLIKQERFSRTSLCDYTKANKPGPMSIYFH